jgi:hypothetical protein
MALNEASHNTVMTGPAGDVPADGTGITQLDPWLSPFRDALRSRYSKAQQWIKTINETEGGMEKFSRGFEKFGFNVKENGDVVYREWAPNALRAYLIGDFSKTVILLRRKPYIYEDRFQIIGIATLRQ